jgi:hypothetical protein
MGRRRITGTIIATAIIAVTAVVTYYYYNHSSSDEYQPATASQKQAGTKAKDEFINDSTAENDRLTDKAEVSSNTPNDARVIITTASQQEADKSLVVGAIVQSSDATGTCKLSAKKSTTEIQQENSAILQSNYSACPDFTVPYSQLSPGIWTVTVTYTDPSKSGEAKREVEIK